MEKLMRSTAATVRYSRTNRFCTEPHRPSRRLKLRKCLLRSWTWMRESALMDVKSLASHPAARSPVREETRCAVRRGSAGMVAVTFGDMAGLIGWLPDAD